MSVKQPRPPPGALKSGPIAAACEDANAKPGNEDFGSVYTTALTNAKLVIGAAGRVTLQIACLSEQSRRALRLCESSSDGCDEPNTEFLLIVSVATISGATTLASQLNVIFASAEQDWCFTLSSFAALYAEQWPGVAADALAKSVRAQFKASRDDGAAVSGFNPAPPRCSKNTWRAPEARVARRNGGRGVPAGGSVACPTTLPRSAGSGVGAHTTAATLSRWAKPHPEGRPNK